MRKYGYLKTFYLAFFSRSLYRDVATNWGFMRSLGYLFVLLGICWAFMLIKIQPVINHAATKFIHQIDVQLPPTIDIKNGIITTTENRPYYIKGPDQHTNWAVIDTSGKFKSLETAHAQLLITKDSILYLDNSDIVHTEVIPAHVTLSFVSMDASHKILKILRWGWIILFPLLLLISFVFRFLECLVLAVMGKIFGGLMRTSLHYLDLLKLSMVAMTPDIVLGTAFRWLGFWINLGWIFYFVLTMIYLIFAISSMRQKN